ncbi:MAG: DUF2142 domain-containing protein [Xanthobacteraceae bacterium]
MTANGLEVSAAVDKVIDDQITKPDPARGDGHCADRDHRIARLLAAAFVLYGIVAAAFLVWNVPPFQVPDEPNHFLRAAQIADGTLVGTPVTITGADGLPHSVAGGMVDPAILDAAAKFAPLWFHSDAKTKRADWAPQIGWSNRRVAAAFPNTAMYPPFFYAPSVVGILAGRAANLTVVQTLILSRALTAASAIALGVLAIFLANGAAPWIFTILTLPMSLFLIASTSQDALLISSGALAGACLIRPVRWLSAQNGKLLAALVVILSAMAMGRPPYLALAVTPLALSQPRLRWRIAAVLTILVCGTAWAIVGARIAWLDYAVADMGTHPSVQLARLLAHPSLIAHVAVATLAQNWRFYFVSFVGELGWLDTPLPHLYDLTGIIIIIAAGAAMLGTDGKRMTLWSAFILAVGLSTAVGGVFAIQYLIGTGQTQDIVAGVQGRYFLPLALVATALMPSLGSTPASRLRKPLVLLVVAFPLVSLTIMMHAIVWRYYLE